MLDGLRDARAVRAVLGPDARVVARRELQRRRNRRAVVAVLADGSSVVVKYYRRAALVPMEALRLETANAFEALDTPRLRGSTRHHLVQDCVPGAGLDEYVKRTKQEERLPLFTRAARVLATIHAGRLPAQSPLRLDEAFAPGLLGAHIRRSWREIETRGFALWEARHGSVPERWRRALDATRIERLVRELASTGEQCVIGHGDFQPRHLVRTPDDRLFVIDWVAMSLVTPWIELAHLLRWIAPEQHAGLTAVYLEAMQRRGRLVDVSPARAESLAARALLYDRLVVAKHRVRKLARADQADLVAGFRRSLDALAEAEW